MSVKDAVVFLTEQMCDRRDERDALQEVLDNIIESGLLSEEQYDVLAAAIGRQSSANEGVSK
jgi:hypothetical protein